MMLNDKEACLLELSALLPLPTRLPDGRHVNVDLMTEYQLTESYNIIQSCAEQSNGFGVDEFRSENEFRTELRDADCFAIMCKESGRMLASFILTVSRYYRGSDSAVDPYILVQASERRKGIGQFCVRTAISFAKKLGYEAMYIDTFSNNEPMKRILKNIGGFTKVGYLPMGGKLKNGDVVATYIYYRPLCEKYSIN